MPTIRDPYTTVSLSGGEATAEAVMEYFASKAEQTVSVRVSHNGQEYDAGTGKNEEFLALPFNGRFTTRAHALAPRGTSCGIVVTGSGTHYVELGAGIEGAYVRSVYRTTTAVPVRQQPCGEAPKEEETFVATDTDGSGGNVAGAGQGKCVYWIRYEVNTGEILHSALVGGDPECPSNYVR